ncbi:MAG: hypothetical protein ACE5GW_10575 [Planctomycetota bacterium]
MLYRFLARLPRAALEGLRELFRGEKLPYEALHPRPSWAHSWLRWLLAPEPLDDRPEPTPPHGRSWARWLLAADRLEDLPQPPPAHRRSWLRWLLSSEPLEDLPAHRPGTGSEAGRLVSRDPLLPPDSTRDGDDR